MPLELSEKLRRRVRYEFIESCDSTMARVRLMIDGAESDAIFVIYAGTQTSGRGRYGRQWLPGSGNIFLSVGFCPGKHALESLVLCVSVLVHRVLARITPVYLKWPNDIYGTKGKLSGALLETYNNWQVLGVGINTLTVPLSYVSSLAQEAHQSIPTNEKIISAILEEFVVWLDSNQTFSMMRDEWLSHALYLNQRVRVDQPGGAYVQGVFSGVSEKGCALVRCEGREHVITHGSLRPIRHA